MTIQEIGEMIKVRRMSRNMSREQLADLVGVTASAIGMWEQGRRKPSTEAVQALADAFNVPAWSILYSDNEMQPVNETRMQSPPTIPNHETYAFTPARAMVPIVGSVQCGPGGLAYQDLQGAEMADVGNPAEYFYLRAVGDSMEPKICAGDLVLIHQQEDVENGDLAVVIIDGEEGMLKKFTRENGAVILQSFNPAYPPRVIIGDAQKSIRIVGKAVRQVRTW